MASIPEPNTIAAVAATKAVEGLGAKIADAGSRLGSKVFDRAKVALEVGFTPFLKKSYERCRYYKTLLDPYAPCDLDKTYINVGLESLSDESEIKDTELIKRFLDGDRFVVTGLAGCGKSMFMRLATLRTFESSTSMPVFFELRRMNGQNRVDLVKAIYDECAPEGSNITYQQFKMALKSGLLALILDGFDEVEYDLRREVSDQINNLILDYPNLKIIVSSRPDNNVFISWAKFEVFEVEKFNQRQTRELVEHARYDDGVKQRFKQALEDKLFDSHGDFLQSPLLTIIMLLTYEEFAEIPNKMHAFYARAFDTLFQKHDADKEQFVRKIKTNLSREDFKLVLSCFCAVSYLAEKFSFEPGELQKFVTRGVQYAENVSPNLKVSAADFIVDLTDAVCLIQEDGRNHVFVHRSFQEYFTAFFLDKIEETKVAPLADKLAERFNDNVLPMAIDMSREKMEISWVQPTVKKYIVLFAPENKKRNSGNVFRTMLGAVHFAYAPPRDPKLDKFVSASFLNLPDDQIGPFEIICREYPNFFERAHIIKPFKKLQIDQLKALTANLPDLRRKNAKLIADFVDDTGEHARATVLEISDADSWWLDVLGFDKNFDEMHAQLELLSAEIERRQARRSTILDELLV